MTSITQVYNDLRLLNIPCSLITPDEDAYVETIKSIIAKSDVHKVHPNHTAFIIVDVSKKDDFYLFNETPLGEMVESADAAELIAIFSQKVHGAIFQMRTTRYLILCDSNNLEIGTDYFKTFELFHQISIYTRLIVSMGIGYGTTLENAKQHAMLALRKASYESRNAA